MPTRTSYAPGTPNWVVAAIAGRHGDPQGAVFSIIKSAQA